MAIQTVQTNQPGLKISSSVLSCRKHRRRGGHGLAEVRRQYQSQLHASRFTRRRRPRRLPFPFTFPWQKKWPSSSLSSPRLPSRIWCSDWPLVAKGPCVFVTSPPFTFTHPATRRRPGFLFLLLALYKPLSPLLFFLFPPHPLTILARCLSTTTSPPHHHHSSRSRPGGSMLT